MSTFEKPIFILSLLFCLTSLIQVNGLPVVDKGVFVIVGVRSCGSGTGYCILGQDCTIDKEFISDNYGNCTGLGTAFTPSAHFSCCQLVNNNTTNEPSTITTSSTSTTENIIITEELEQDNSSVDSSSSSNEQNSNENTSNNNSIENSNSMLNNTITTTTKPTTTTFYEEKTEINLEQTIISLQELNCGKNYGNGITTNGIGRVASEHLSPLSSTVSPCYIVALVRSPLSSYSLQDPGSFLCTGAMITRDTLLTSATCVSRLLSQELNLFKAILGSKHLIHPSHGLSNNNENNYRNIEEIRVHSDYNININGNNHNNNGFNTRIRQSDIALVRLSPLKNNNNINYCSICLPDKYQNYHNNNNNKNQSSSTTTCSVTGYSHPPDSNDADGFLHEAPQIIESPQHCNSTNLLCASGQKAAEACFSPRDAGSPLTCLIDDTPKLVGIFSSGFHCGNYQSPVYYTDIRQFIDWIKDYAA